MTTSTRRFLGLAAAMAAGVWFIGPTPPAARAQVRAGGNGHAHDANQRVGSGRINSQQPQADYQQRNNLVTGNVVGGGNLEIAQPFPAPGEFQDRIGSNDLFNFQARSFHSSPGSLNATAPSVNLGGQPSIYRSFRSGNNGRIDSQQAYQRNRVAPRGGNYTASDLAGTSSLNGPINTYDNETAGGTPAYLSDTRPSVTASPLLGVRQTGHALNPQTPEVPATPGEALQAAEEQPTGGADLNNQTNANGPENANNKNNEEQNAATDQRLGQRVGDLSNYQSILTNPETPADQAQPNPDQNDQNSPNGNNPGEQGPNGQTQQQGQNGNGPPRNGQGASPTLLIGQQLQQQGRLGSRRLGRRVDDNARRRMNQIGRNLVNQAAVRARQGERSPYDQLLNAVQGQGGRNNPPGAGEGGGKQGAGQGGPMGNAGGAGGQGGLSLSSPAMDQMQQAEQARRAALRRAYGQPSGDQSGEANSNAPSNGQSAPPASPAQKYLDQVKQSQAKAAQQAGEGSGDNASSSRGPNGNGSPQGQPEQAAPQTDAVNQLLGQLDYNLAPLQTLVGENNSRTTRMMKQAEQDLAAGKYFDSERLYGQVVAARPNAPMARVGLVHAQLGAGLIRSAALNLRHLFDQHPEMIAARYSSRLLPNEKRLQYIRKQLDRNLSSSQGGAAASLLMAYLGYQVHSPQLVRYGLAISQSRSPRDPLWPVLRRIWLNPDAHQTQSKEPRTK